jgi:hypothetical protein
MYPPPGVPPAIVAEVERFEAIAGVVLSTGFGGLIGGLALALGAPEPSARVLILAASLTSGCAALLACHGLTCSFATNPPEIVLARKWLGGKLAVWILLVAVWLGLLGGSSLV